MTSGIVAATAHAQGALTQVSFDSFCLEWHATVGNSSTHMLYTYVGLLAHMSVCCRERVL